MSSAIYAAFGIAALGLLAAVMAVVIALRNSRPPQQADVSGPLISQIEQVRGELRDLSNLFTVPRTRGAVGETLLAELLAAWLPERSYELQYTFSNGTRVDAAIRIGKKIVPVDSKFPLEAYQRAGGSDGIAANAKLPAEVARAVSKHIDDISGKYLLPHEDTMPFALMYIPSEPVYIDLFAGRSTDLLQRALEKNVVPTSPSTLFLYLQTVAYGLRGLQIPEEAERMLKNLKRLDGALAAFQKEFTLAGTHLRNLSRAFDEATSTLSRVASARDRLIGDDRE